MCCVHVFMCLPTGVITKVGSCLLGAGLRFTRTRSLKFETPKILAQEPRNVDVFCSFTLSVDGSMCSCLFSAGHAEVVLKSGTCAEGIPSGKHETRAKGTPS